MDLICVADGDLEQYEELLLQKDHLEKEAFAYSREYTRVFGDLTVEAFSLKLDCILLKKTISLHIAAQNRGEAADPAAIAEEAARQMAAYRVQLEELIAERDSARRGKPLSPYEAGEVKKLYRRIAKLLHPDISPLTEQVPELNELFQQVMTAYRCNDLKELKKLEALIDKAFSEHGINRLELSLTDVNARIRELEQEIGQILSTEPYLYKELLADAFRVEEKKEELQKEIASWREYRTHLESQLKELTGGEENG